MKTFNGNTISKKNIQSVLRTMDKTAIWKLVHTIYGGKTTGKQVADFMHEFAPNQTVERHVYDIAYQHNYQDPRRIYDSKGVYEFYMANIKHEAIQYLKEQLKDVHSPYAKRPMMGYTHLYFCSPVYGHSDYNKWRCMPIKGNEKFCEVIIKLADKYF